jgi:hypothetical protein
VQQEVPKNRPEARVQREVPKNGLEARVRQEVSKDKPEAKVRQEVPENKLDAEGKLVPQRSQWAPRSGRKASREKGGEEERIGRGKDFPTAPGTP